MLASYVATSESSARIPSKTSEAQLFYPDNGGALEDQSILRNAAEFSTPQRAWRAMQTLTERFEHLNNRQRAGLALEGFQAMVVSLEDLLVGSLSLTGGAQALQKDRCSRCWTKFRSDEVGGTTTGLRKPEWSFLIL